MLNWIWLGLILGAVVYAAFTGRMEAVSTAAFEEAKGAVHFVIGLTGVMVLFLGLMNVARDGGLLDFVARALRPLLRRLKAQQSRVVCIDVDGAAIEAIHAALKPALAKEARGGAGSVGRGSALGPVE